jgi:hypothetical protein
VARQGCVLYHRAIRQSPAGNGAATWAIPTATLLRLANTPKLRSTVSQTTSVWPAISPEPLAQQKGLGCRAECFQSLTVVLQPSHSCSITSFWGECKSSNGSPRPGVSAKRMIPLERPKGGSMMAVALTHVSSSPNLVSHFAEHGLVQPVSSTMPPDHSFGSDQQERVLPV